MYYQLKCLKYVLKCKLFILFVLFYIFFFYYYSIFVSEESFFAILGLIRLLDSDYLIFLWYVFQGMFLVYFLYKYSYFELAHSPEMLFTRTNRLKLYLLKIVIAVFLLAVYRGLIYFLTLFLLKIFFHVSYFSWEVFIQNFTHYFIYFGIALFVWFIRIFTQKS